MRTDPDNELFAQLFEQINSITNLGVMIDGTDPKQFIDKGYLYNDLVFSLISIKYDMTLPIDWYAYEVVDEMKFRRIGYLQKTIASGKDVNKNLKELSKLKYKALKPAEGSEVARLINYPNSYKSFSELVAEFFVWMDLTGNYYLYGHQRSDTNDKIISLHNAPAHEVEIVAGTTFDPIKGYRIKAFVNNQNEVIPAEKVMHIKTFNPNYRIDGSHLYGISPLQAGYRIINLDNTGVDTSTSNFANSGVRGIITAMQNKDGMETGLTPEQAKQLKEKVQSWSGKGKSGSVVATNAPVSFLDIGKSPVDLGVYTAMDKNMVRLCNLLKVPPELYMPGTTFSNKAEARKKMITAGILPYMDLFKQKFNQFAVKRYNRNGKKYVVDYDMFSITELQDDLKSIMDMYAGKDWITKNEKREATNYPSISEEKDPAGLADTLMIDPFKVPLSDFNMMQDDGFNNIDETMKRLNSSTYGKLETDK